MNCSEFEIQLQELVESRQNHLSEAGSQHVHGCAGCRHRWQDHRLIAAAIGALQPIKPPAWLSEAVMAELLDDQKATVASSSPDFDARRSNRANHWVVVAAAAMCLVFAIGFGLTGKDVSQQIALTPAHQPNVEPGPVEVAPSVAAVFDDLRAEYHELAAETKATARDFAAALPPNVASVWKPDGRLIPGSEGELNPSNVADRTTASRSASNIGRSFSEQVGQAIDFLWIAAPNSVPRG